MKDIKDYIHYYIGQRFVFDNKIWNIVRVSTTLVRGVRDNKGEEKFMQVYHHEAKLLLRRLSDMTEEEATSAYIIERDRVVHDVTIDFDVSVRDHGFVITRLDLLNVRLMIGYNGQIYKVIEETKKPTIEPANNQQLIIHYLLKQGFDLFGLIDEGLAIDSKTIQPQTNNDGK